MTYRRLRKWFKYEGREDLCVSGLDLGLESRMQFLETCIKMACAGWEEIKPKIIKVNCGCN